MTKSRYFHNPPPIAKEDFERGYLKPLSCSPEAISAAMVRYHDADIQQCEAETGHSPGQKRAGQTIGRPSAAEEPKPKRRRGARKKVRTEEELAIRRENHLQRNRDAAQKCRQKMVAEAKKEQQMVIEL
ncbi:hypothetical protein IFR05_008455 [Cadophora sp. M221]|nr:hypothetical protein IFR05_008455 [Cadophora sp. M221]